MPVTKHMKFSAEQMDALKKRVEKEGKSPIRARIDGRLHWGEAPSGAKWSPYLRFLLKNDTSAYVNLNMDPPFEITINDKPPSHIIAKFNSRDREREKREEQRAKSVAKKEAAKQAKAAQQAKSSAPKGAKPKLPRAATVRATAVADALVDKIKAAGVKAARVGPLQVKVADGTAVPAKSSKKVAKQHVATAN